MDIAHTEDLDTIKKIKQKTMKLTIPEKAKLEILDELKLANLAFQAVYPGV